MKREYVLIYLATCQNPDKSKWLFVGDAAIGTKAPFELAKKFTIVMAEHTASGLRSFSPQDMIAIVHIDTYING